MTLRVVYYILGLNSHCSPPQPPIFDTKKVSQPTTVRFEPGLSADT